MPGLVQFYAMDVFALLLLFFVFFPEFIPMEIGAGMTALKIT